MRRFSVLAIVVLLSVGSLFGQRNAREDYEFGRYLLGQGLLREATTLTHNLPSDYTPAALDTMRYLKGWTLYNTRKFSSAATAFSSVAPTSHFYPKSTFYGVVCDLESGNIEGAKSRLDAFTATPVAVHYKELVAFERGGIALLEGNREEYNLHRKEFSFSNYAFAEEERQLEEIATHPPRNLKPWVAGVASAVLPGLGQIYAGNVSEGLASFIAVGAFAALTATSWNKAGTPLNWRTITYGTVGSLLYIGNIFGSIASVKIYYQNFEEINHQAVMYSIHIPLRDIFE